MLGLQPAVVGAAEFCEGSEFDHGMFLLNLWDAGASRPARYFDWIRRRSRRRR